MLRPAGAVLTCAVLLGAAALPGAASAADDPSAYTRHGEVLNILPPGSRGKMFETAVNFRRHEPHRISGRDQLIELPVKSFGKQRHDLDARWHGERESCVGRRDDLMGADRTEILDQRRAHGGAFARERGGHIPSRESAAARVLVNENPHRYT